VGTKLLNGVTDKCPFVGSQFIWRSRNEISLLVETLCFSLAVHPSVQKRVCQLRLCAVILTGLLVILSCSLTVVDLTRLLLNSAPLFECAWVYVKRCLGRLLLRVLTKLVGRCLREASVVVRSIASARLTKVVWLGIGCLHSSVVIDSFVRVFFKVRSTSLTRERGDG
jgi:hypothetical protein